MHVPFSCWFFKPTKYPHESSYIWVTLVPCCLGHMTSVRLPYENGCLCMPLWNDSSKVTIWLSGPYWIEEPLKYHWLTLQNRFTPECIGEIFQTFVLCILENLSFGRWIFCLWKYYTFTLSSNFDDLISVPKKKNRLSDFIVLQEITFKIHVNYGMVQSL